MIDFFVHQILFDKYSQDNGGVAGCHLYMA